MNTFDNACRNRLTEYRSRMLPKATRAALLTTVAAALAGCGSSHHTASTAHPSTTSTTSRTTTRALVVSLTTPTSEPSAGGFWPVTIRAHTATGTPAGGTVSYAFLFGGAVVARRPGGQMRDGVFHDRLEFPAQAVGYPLTLQVIVRGAAGQSGSTERPVTVHH
jgi:hypothetical protein